jgi:hypothetical protein
MSQPSPGAFTGVFIPIGLLLCGKADFSRRRLAGAAVVVVALATIVLLDLLAPPVVLVKTY